MPVHHVYAHDTATATESAFVVGSSPEGDGHIGMSRGAPDERTAVADYTAASDLVADRVDGAGPDRDRSELRAAKLLVDRLNDSGAAWHDPQLELAGAPEERGVDCVARDDAGAELLIQVTTTERELWHLHDRDPQAVRQAKLAQVVEAVRAAIQHKAFHADPDIVLVLDATDSPRTAFPAVAEEFRQQHGAWASTIGFAGIWLVGPVVSLVTRLA
jgi:hypothetical protein